MRDDEQRAMIEALEPYREMTARLIGLVEKLTTRVENLELELLHQRPAPICTPNAPPALNAGDGPPAP